MVTKMKNYKLVLLISLGILVVFELLFGYPPQGRAQEDQDWTKPVNISLSGVAVEPFLVIDSDNVLHVIWVDEFDGYKYSQSADGVTWTKPQTVKFPFDKNGAPPVLLSDPNGLIHIFWISKDMDLFYAKTNPLNMSSPTKWQSKISLAKGVVNYDVNLDSQGVLHIAYIQIKSSTTRPAGIYYRRSKDGGISSWNGEIKLYESEYLRSATGSESFVRIATSNTLPDQRVYVAWDIRLEKRVFMAVSSDSGKNWNEAQQIKGVEDTGGIDTPFNLNVAAANDKVLMMWQGGEAGTAKCTMFSQWSEDNGESWGDIYSVLGGGTDCPVSTKFIVQDEDHFVAILKGQVDPTLIAWNGKQWSDPQTQTRFPAFSNPLTYDSVLLGCRFDLVQKNRLYVVGCDQGGGGDVWFLSRSLEPVENWFSLPKTWGVPVIISGESEKISSLSSASDTEGVVHLIWAESSSPGDGSQKVTMEYASWDGKQWTRPEPVISSLDAIPMQMSFMIDTQERLLLSWVDPISGDLLFSWANLDGANLASNWDAPAALPSPSNLIDSPDIVVDGSGRIVVVYAIPLNEDRGIYIVQSTDRGVSWSSPVRVFDAVSARWEKIGSPKTSLSADGVLHLIFSRNSVRTGQPSGLYYSRSMDGGATWSDPQILSEADIQWSDIVSYDEQTVHVLWQEYDGLVFANLSQVSQDNGISWSKTLNITGVNDSSTSVALAADGSGKLHLFQLLKNSNVTTINQDNLILQDWKWNGSSWEFASSSDLVIEGKGRDYSLVADITPAGNLGVYMLVEYSDSENKIQNEILTLNRFLEEGDTLREPVAVLIPTPAISSDEADVPDDSPTQVADLFVFYDDNVGFSPKLRNIIGISILAVAMVVITIIVIRKRNLFNK